jgi:hypothetical protein
MGARRFRARDFILPDSKTGRKPVYLSPAALDVLANLPRIEGNAFVIPGAKDGAPRADLKRPWAAVRKAAGLEGFRGSWAIPKPQPRIVRASGRRSLLRAVDTIGATIAAAMAGARGGEIVRIEKSGSAPA